MKALFTQLDGTDRWTDWEVTGSTAALLHTGKSFIPFTNIFQTLFFFLKPLNVPRQIAGFFVVPYKLFFRGHLKFLPEQIVHRTVTYWGVCEHMERLTGFEQNQCLHVDIDIYIVIKIDANQLGSFFL